MHSRTESKQASLLRPAWRLAFVYYAIACGWAWLAWSPVVLGSGGLKLLHISASVPVFSCIATLGPFFGCFITHRLETQNWRAVRLLPRDPGGWLWLVIGPLLVLVSFFLIFPAFVSKGTPAHWHWHPAGLIGLWIPMFNYNLLGGPLFEEFGWRGFLQVHLQAAMPPWVAAACVGIMWALWHAPLLLVSWTSASPLTYILIVVGLSILMASAFNATGGAVVAAILMHSAFNASPRFIQPFLDGTLTRESPSAEMLIALAFLTIAVLAVIFTRGQLNAQAVRKGSCY